MVEQARHTIRIDVFAKDFSSYEELDPYAFSAEMAEALAKVPPEYRESVTLEFVSDYDSSGVQIDCHYDRLETEEEAADRIAAYEREKADRERELVRRDLTQLAMLRQKYGL